MQDVNPITDGVAENGETLFQLGLMYATGRDVDPDFVEAHKWFNLAAMRGSEEAVEHRRELSSQMTKDDIVHAQRQAREWLGMH